MMITPELILTLALDGTDQECMAAERRPRHLVIQQALRLADDPVVALEHPELTQRIHGRVEQLRARRGGGGVR